MTDPSLKEPAQPFLIVIGGPRDGDTVDLDSPGVEKILGSGPDCHLRLEGGNIDYHHARIIWDEERGVLLSNEATGAGTFVNGEAIGPNHHLLDGDRICLGPPGSSGSVKLLARVPAPPAVPHRLLADAEPELALLAPPRPTEGAGGSPAPGASSTDDEDVFDATESDRAPAPPTNGAAAPPDSSSSPGEARRAGREDLTVLPSIVVNREAPVATPVTDTALQKLVHQRERTGLARKLAIGGVVVLVGLGLFLTIRLLPGSPVLTAVVPPKVEPGGTFTVTGSGFEPNPGRNTVRVGQTVAEVTSASGTQLTVRIPATLGAVPSDLPLTVATRGGRSNALFLRVRVMPHASGLDPEVALPGETVSLKGQQLTAWKSLAVFVDELPADVQAVEPAVLRFKVPEMRFVEGRTVTVRLQAGGETARPLTLTLGRLPLVAQLTPPKGPPGERVVIKGFGFDPSRAGNLVTFGEEPALVLSASETELVVAAAFEGDGQSQAALPVLVKSRGRLSSGSSVFTQLRQSSGTFEPRFFVAPVPGDPTYEHVFVSSELGPCLLLSDKDDAPSTAERGMRVARALNSLFEEATSQPVRLEVREGPAPAVAIAGKPAALVRATLPDAAGYGQPWDAGMKGQRTTPAELARYWVSLLQDLQTLFVQHERPTRVLEMSSRGKVFLYLFSEGERRSGPGMGVPVGLLSPPSFTLLKSLREMALVLPAKGEAAAAAAVSGRWEGTLEEKGVGQRRIRLELHLQGGRLVGTLTTTVREISMDIVLEGASYEKGALTFSYSGGSGVRRFRGTVQGATINGTIHGGDGQEIGRFSLRFSG